MRIACWVVPVMLLAAVPASAQPEAPPPKPKLPWQEQLALEERAPAPSRPLPPPRTWYGWQVMAADGLALGLIVVGGIVDTSEIGTVGAGLLVAGAPVVHLANLHFGSAAISFGMRAGALALSIGALVALVDDSESRSGELAGLLSVSAVIGWLATWIVDPAFLSYRDPAPDAQPVSFVPWFDLERGRGGLHVALQL